jgi:hypothetical protein
MGRKIVKHLIRRSAGVALAACVLVAPSVVGVGTASAGTLPPSPCTSGYSDGTATTVPTARKAGVRLRQWIPVRNHQSVVIPNAYVNITTTGDVQRKAPLPSVWWRAAGGQWKRATLTWTWNGPTALRMSQWLSSNLEMGNLAPHATKWLEVDVYFPAHSIKGAYYQDFLVHSHSCDSAANLSFYQGVLEYWPWHGLEGHPA